MRFFTNNQCVSEPIFNNSDDCFIEEIVNGRVWPTISLRNWPLISLVASKKSLNFSDSVWFPKLLSYWFFSVFFQLCDVEPWTETPNNKLFAFKILQTEEFNEKAVHEIFFARNLRFNRNRFHSEISPKQQKIQYVQLLKNVIVSCLAVNNAPTKTLRIA